MISNVKYGGIFLSTPNVEDNLQSIVLWPNDDHIPATLTSIAENTIKYATETIKKTVDDGVQVVDYVAYPLVEQGQTLGVVVLALSVRSEQQCQAVLQLVNWGAVFLEKVLERNKIQHLNDSSLALKAIALFTQDEPLAVNGYHFCNFIADNFDCTSAELGLCKSLQVKMLSLSHQLHFEGRVDRIRQVEFAMEECIEQNQNIIFQVPSQTTNSFIHTHTQQLLNGKEGTVCSIIIGINGIPIGVLTLIFQQQNKGVINQEVLKRLVVIADSIAPIIHLKMNDSLPIWKKMMHSAKKPVRRLIGLGHFKAKMIVLTSLILFAVLTLVKTDKIITAQALVEGKMQQAIVAPYSSYIASAGARAGDLVEKDQILATLDDKDLQLEYDKWSSERDRQVKEYHQALAIRDRPKISILLAGIAQTDAQLESVKEQLLHTQLKAPFSGLLVSGDWTQALGAPIERGQLLFEVIPAKNYRVTLQVDEHDVSTLVSGQQANLRLTGLSGQLIALRISQIFPVASVTQGSNNFRVESEIIAAPDGLRPGMQGIAKIVVGRGSLLSVWTDSLLSRLRLWAWSMGI
jgi:multidrug efflux pump subunit AcrA (membrane-fusion protein)